MSALVDRPLGNGAIRQQAEWYKSALENHANKQLLEHVLREQLIAARLVDMSVSVWIILSLTSPANHMFVQQLVQNSPKGDVENLLYWSFVKEIHISTMSWYYQVDTCIMQNCFKDATPLVSARQT